MARRAQPGQPDFPEKGVSHLYVSPHLLMATMTAIQAHV
jgi:hypothetical protein